jgi:hypothetical protein
MAPGVVGAVSDASYGYLWQVRSLLRVYCCFHKLLCTQIQEMRSLIEYQRVLDDLQAAELPRLT